MTKYLLDTNIVVDFLSGKKTVVDSIEETSEIFVSIITVVEFLSQKDLTDSQIKLFKKYLSSITVIDLLYTPKSDLITNAITIRKNGLLKLPDAIIAASAISHKATLVSRDTDFKKIKGLKIKSIG